MILFFRIQQIINLCFTLKVHFNLSLYWRITIHAKCAFWNLDDILWSSVILDCSAIKELQESSPLTKFYDCSSQFLKSVTTTATSIFDVQATGGDNDEEEDEAK